MPKEDSLPPQGDPGEAQADDGYKCSCGFITDDKGKFFHHIGSMCRLEGKGSHKSEGRVNLQTGMITMPPYEQRTEEQRTASIHAKKAKKSDLVGTISAVRTTDILQSASSIKFIPRIYTTSYTPIMMQAQDAATRFFGWPSNMPFEDFLDTTLVKAFKMWGIELGSYKVADDLVRELTEKQAAEEALIDENKEEAEVE